MCGDMVYPWVFRLKNKTRLNVAGIAAYKNVFL